MTGPQKFRKKPVEVEATRWDGSSESAEEITAWARKYGTNILLSCELGEESPSPTHGSFVHYLVIETLEGNMIARTGYWIIRGVQGEFYPCKPDIFEATYEAA